jgi:predicted PurR-regulated permease PerM
LLGIEQWLALAVLAGGLTFIPNFGILVTLVMALAVGIVQAPEYIWIILLIIIGVNMLESQLVSPILANENLNIPPLLILVGQIIIGIFFGFLGIMLAVPITAIVVVLVREIYIKDILGDNQIASIFEEPDSDILSDNVEERIEEILNVDD